MNRRPHTKLHALLAGVQCTLLLSATAQAAPEGREAPVALAFTTAGRSDGLLDRRGTPLDVAPLLHWDEQRVVEYLDSFGLDSSRARFGVDAYRVVYRTLDVDGSPTTASSLVALPRVDGNQERIKQVIWLHDTLVYKDDAASVFDDSDERAVAFAFAAAGYLTTAPDYLGLGLGLGTPRYNDRDSEVSVSIDALHATRTLAAWLRLHVDSSVAISGFSQGGASSMALARALQERADPYLRVSALAPIAGPYDMSGTLASALSGEVNSAGPYLAHLVVGWNRLHTLYDDPTQVFLPPYDRLAEELFDGEHTPEEVLSFLPDRADALFTPDFLQRLAHPSRNLRATLAASDAVCDFRPAITTHLYAASGDRDVLIANSKACETSLESRGATVQLHDLGELDHSDSLASAIEQVLELLSRQPQG